LLLAPDHNTVVDTKYGAVVVSAGSVALLISTEQGLAVYDLHDTHKGAVEIRRDDHNTTLIPGTSAVLTSTATKSFEEINPAQFVNYRGLNTGALSSETKVYLAEFEIMSMMQGLKPLGCMAASENPMKRKTMANMLKTAAILMEVTQGREPFKPFATPTVTACAPIAQQ
jgi:hypothetical protein